MTRTIEISDIGAITNISIPIPEDGGFVVLKGTHGVGKSTTLEAVASLVSGNGTLDKRDGAIEGKVSGFGAMLTVKKVVRRTGQPEIAVDSLAGRLSLADIVDPHIKDPLAADAYRIKALLEIAGAKPDATDFHELVGGPQEFPRRALLGRNARLPGEADDQRPSDAGEGRLWRAENERAVGRMAGTTRLAFSRINRGDKWQR